MSLIPYILTPKIIHDTKGLPQQAFIASCQRGHNRIIVREIPYRKSLLTEAECRADEPHCAICADTSPSPEETLLQPNYHYDPRRRTTAATPGVYCAADNEEGSGQRHPAQVTLHRTTRSEKGRICRSASNMCRQHAKQQPGQPVTPLGRPCRMGPLCALNREQNQDESVRIQPPSR